MAPTAHSDGLPGAVVADPLLNAKFTLDSSGVAGFFGGDTAVYAMATVSLFPGRKWGGLYNTPGSLEIAKKYGQLANARFYKGLFPGEGTADPSKLFGFDGKHGPRFLSARSGSHFEQTGHPAALVERYARRLPVHHPRQNERTTSPATVTLIDLPTAPAQTLKPQLQDNAPALRALVPIGASVGACVGCALVADWWSCASILLGMLANGCACFVLGSSTLAFRHPKGADGAPPGDGLFKYEGGVIVVRGSEDAVNALTRGRFFLRYEGWRGAKALQSGRPEEPIRESRTPRRPFARGSASRDGNFTGADIDCDEQTLYDGHSGVPHDDDAYISGSPDADMPETPAHGERGQQKGGGGGGHDGGQPDSVAIGLCSMLLMAQFLVQLLLIPQGVLFGQAMFVCTLAVSWAHNAYLSSIDREDIQTDILLHEVLRLPREAVGAGAGVGEAGGCVRKFEFGTWTAMSIFALLALQPGAGAGAGGEGDGLRHSRKVLDELLPNDTEVWAAWKEMVRGKMAGVPGEWDFAEEDYFLKEGGTDAEQWNGNDRTLFRALIDDAKVANRRFREEELVRCKSELKG